MKKRILGVLGAVVMVVVGGSVVFAEGIASPTDEQKNNCKSKGGQVQLADGKYYCRSKDSGYRAKSSVREKRCNERKDGSSYIKVQESPERWLCDIGWSASSGGGNTGGGTTGGGTSGGGSSEDNGNGVTRADEHESTIDTGCADGEVKTNFFGGDDGCVNTADGEGIYRILAVVINVLTFGIGIAATIGFVISGLQYIMARDNAAQIEKAKMRMFQIVIGLVVYAMIWAVLQWLIPGGAFAS